MSQPHDPESEIRRNAAPENEIPRHDSPDLPPNLRDESREPARTTTAPNIARIGFDDPELRPLPPDQLHYRVPHPDPRPEQHEHSDVPIRPLAIALISIATVIVLSFGLLYWLFWHYDAQQRALERPRTAVPAAKPVVPGPRLQGVPGFSDNDPTQDMQLTRERYRAQLNAYAPPGPDGKAKIPIERAMELALERNMFPVAQTGATTQPSRPRNQGGQR
jgi:hypothetical protein